MQSCAGPADADCLDELHAALERLWEEAPDVERRQRMRLATALSELVTNIVAHGHTADGRTPTITLRLSAHPERLEAELIDDGVAVTGSLNRGLPPDNLAEGGRGLTLARKMVDELRYEHEQGTNRWMLLIHRGSGR